MRPTTQLSLAALLAVALCATRARAQSDPDAGASAATPTPTTPTAPSRWLAPPPPDGGTYAPPPAEPSRAPSTPAPVTSGGDGVAAPTTTTPAAGTTAPTTGTAPATPAGTPSAPQTPGATGSEVVVGGVRLSGPAPAPAPGAATGSTDQLVLRPAAPPRRPSLMRERLRLLNTALPPIAARSRSQRILDGVVSLVLGTGIGALSFALPASSGSNDLRPWFWVTAGVSIASGVLTLAWAPARETLTAQFERMPMETARQRRARVLFGERALEDMAADGARRRVLSALGNSAVSVAMLAIIYRDPIFNGVPYTFTAFDAIVLGVSGLSVVTSLIGLFGRSEEERLRESYWQQVRILRAERGIPATTP